MASLPAPSRARTMPGLPVPDEPRPQLGEVVARVPAGQQVEHRGEHVVGQLGEVRDAADHRAQLVDVPLVDRAHRHELLGEHVERVARVVRLLDQAGAHPLRHDRRLQQVAAELREDLAAAGLADLVAGAADALQAARDRARATPPGSPGRRRPCRCRARGRTWRRSRAGVPPSARPPPRSAARARASRGARAPGPPPPAR